MGEWGRGHRICSRLSILTFVQQKPECDEWGSGLEAMQVALQLEKSVNQSLLDLHKLCTSHEDAQVGWGFFFFPLLFKGMFVM